MFKSVPGCIEGIPGHYGMFGGCSRGVPGLFWAVPGCSGGVPGVFRGVPGCSGVFRVCSGFYRHPILHVRVSGIQQSVRGLVFAVHCFFFVILKLRIMGLSVLDCRTPYR